MPPEDDVTAKPTGRSAWREALRRTAVRHRPRLQRMGALFAAVAAVGAVLGGLTGYWSAYKTVAYDVLGLQKPADQSASKTAVPGRYSIAVLPFTALHDGTPDYLGSGITNSLTTDLSIRVPGLFIIGVDSAFTYLKTKADPQQLWRELGARYVLFGTVQRNHSRVRVDARLVETQTARQLWAEKFEGTGDDPFAIQDLISARIANSFGVALLRYGSTEAERRQKPEVVDLVFRAQAEFLTNNRTVDSLKTAESLYRQALALDPKNPDALNGLGNLLAVRLSLHRFNLRMTPEQISAAVTEARELLDRGLLIDPRSAIGHNGKGRLYSVERKPQESAREHEMARTLDPNYAVNYHNLAAVALALGQPRDAVNYLNEAVARSPRDPAMGVIQMHFTRAYVLLGQWNDAIEAGAKAGVLPTDKLTLNLNLAAAFAQKGDAEKAKGALQEALKLRPEISIARIEAMNEPAYLQLAQDTLMKGLRIAGLPEK